jgi:hypothetical protein
MEAPTELLDSPTAKLILVITSRHGTGFSESNPEEIFLNSGPFAITEQDLDVCYPW